MNERTEAFMLPFEALPPLPVTEEELAAIQFPGWRRYLIDSPDASPDASINRFRMCSNTWFHWRVHPLDGRKILCANMTPHSKPLDSVCAVFYRDWGDGLRDTQFVELTPTESELTEIATERERIQKYYGTISAHLKEGF